MLDKWCDKIWLYVLYLLGTVMAAALVINWQSWTQIQKILVFSTVVLPLHVLEEWQVPGGFHYQYNLTQRSLHPDCYPMNRLTDMITNFGGELFMIGLSVYGSNTGIIIALAIFSALEVVIHTFFGIKMYSLFRMKGKRTIYGPGSVTAYAGFGTIGLLSLYWLIKSGTIPADWLVAVVVLFIMLAGFILVPENLLKSEKTAFPFHSAMYFSKYIAG
jgi:hypothetical protein